MIVIDCDASGPRIRRDEGRFGGRLRSPSVVVLFYTHLSNMPSPLLRSFSASHVNGLLCCCNRINAVIAAITTAIRPLRNCRAIRYPHLAAWQICTTQVGVLARHKTTMTCESFMAKDNGPTSVFDCDFPKASLSGNWRNAVEFLALSMAHAQMTILLTVTVKCGG